MAGAAADTAAAAAAAAALHTGLCSLQCARWQSALQYLAEVQRAQRSAAAQAQCGALQRMAGRGAVREAQRGY